MYRVENRSCIFIYCFVHVPLIEDINAAHSETLSTSHLCRRQFKMFNSSIQLYDERFD